MNEACNIVSRFSYFHHCWKKLKPPSLASLTLVFHYKTACELMKETLGRPERIFFVNVQVLLNGKVTVKARGSKRVSQLWNLRNELLTHIRSQDALGVFGKQCEIFLTPIILSCFSSEIRWSGLRQVLDAKVICNSF